MPGYKHPCRYCNTLVEKDAEFCPACGKAHPTGPVRCQWCKSPIVPGQAVCSNCGMNLQITCPFCGQATFFGDYCDACGQRLVQPCPHCGSPQALVAQTCEKCRKPMAKGKGKS
jgi:RNA polymerase subunit RPABC4/transcription elongation factor Spt4